MNLKPVLVVVEIPKGMHRDDAKLLAQQDADRDRISVGYVFNGRWRQCDPLDGPTMTGIRVGE